MRVEVVEKVPKRDSLRDLSAAEPGAALALKNFAAAIDSDDSLFHLVEPLAAPTTEVAEGGGFYIGDVLLQFRDPGQAQQKGLHFLLVEKLIELLKDAGSAQSLTATLCLTSEKDGSPGQKNMALWVNLAAKGESPEQAALRWSLGLTHLQQALLFTSRHLRMQLAKNN